MLSRSDTAAINDSEFGKIAVRRNSRAKHVRLRMESDGRLVITLPRFASLKHAEKMVDTSRDSIRRWQKKHAAKTIVFQNDDRIGQSHTVKFTPMPIDQTKIRIDNLVINVQHPGDLPSDHQTIQQYLREYVLKALQKEARAYLPRRLRYLAEHFGFDYERVRFGTQKGRWGSCSSKGTISLNVSLMMLDLDLIDYVLVHELCHTKNMNHSLSFWESVEKCLPDYKDRRRRLKAEQPNL